MSVARHVEEADLSHGTAVQTAAGAVGRALSQCVVVHPSTEVVVGPVRGGFAQVHVPPLCLSPDPGRLQVLQTFTPWDVENAFPCPFCVSHSLNAQHSFPGTRHSSDCRNPTYSVRQLCRSKIGRPHSARPNRGSAYHSSGTTVTPPNDQRKRGQKKTASLEGRCGLKGSWRPEVVLTQFDNSAAQRLVNLAPPVQPGALPTVAVAQQRRHLMINAKEGKRRQQV